MRDCFRLANEASSDGIVICSNMGYVDKESGFYGGTLHVVQIGSGYGRRSESKNRKTTRSYFSVQMSLHDDHALTSGFIQLSPSTSSDVIVHLGSLHYNARLPLEYDGDLSLLEPQISLDYSYLNLGIVEMGSSRGFQIYKWGLYRGFSAYGSLVSDEVCIIKVIGEGNQSDDTYHSGENTESGMPYDSRKSTTISAGLVHTSTSTAIQTCSSTSEGNEPCSSRATEAAAPITNTASNYIAPTAPSSTSSSNITPPVTEAQVQTGPSASAFQLPGRSLQVLPIGLGVFAGVSVVALVIVGIVTYERKKYRNQFRARKAAGSQRIPEFGTESRPGMGEVRV